MKIKLTKHEFEQLKNEGSIYKTNELDPNIEFHIEIDSYSDYVITALSTYNDVEVNDE